jgi:hypothetical protein
MMRRHVSDVLLDVARPLSARRRIASAARAAGSGRIKWFAATLFTAGWSFFWAHGLGLVVLLAPDWVTLSAMLAGLALIGFVD